MDLNSSYNTLTILINRAEDRLRALRPIRSVWCAYSDGLIGMEKYNNKWRLMHAKPEEGSCDIKMIKPLQECPVAIRTIAARSIRQLHKAIIEDLESHAPELQRSIDELQAYCDER